MMPEIDPDNIPTLKDIIDDDISDDTSVDETESEPAFVHDLLPQNDDADDEDLTDEQIYSIGTQEAPDIHSEAYHEDNLAALNQPYQPFIPESRDELPDDEPEDEAETGVTATAETAQTAVIQADDVPAPDVPGPVETEIPEPVDIEQLTDRITGKIMPQIELQLKLIVRHALTDHFNELQKKEDR